MLFLQVLAIIFILAKLFGLITWGWLLVFSPVLVIVLFYVIVVIIAFVLALNEMKINRGKK